MPPWFHPVNSRILKSIISRSNNFASIDCHIGRAIVHVDNIVIACFILHMLLILLFIWMSQIINWVEIYLLVEVELVVVGVGVEAAAPAI